VSEPVPFDPAAARLDQETENELYALYRAFFADAEDNRVWNVWETIPWEATYSGEPSTALTDAVLRCYEAELFLPDYSTVLLKNLRASRARTWFVTRWMYEEGKHLLALGEWLTRRGLFTDPELAIHVEAMQKANRWEAPSTEATALFVDSLLYETQEIARYREVRRLAEAEADTPLLTLADRIITDEEAQRVFFAQALGIIGKRYSEKVANAVEVIAATQPDPEATRRTLKGLLDLPTG